MCFHFNRLTLDMTFEDYLINKKIDLEFFQKAEPALFENWKKEFAQMHPNSFSAQKLYLINPIRRKYPLKIASSNLDSATTMDGSLSPKAENIPSKPARPVFKPKPKIS